MATKRKKTQSITDTIAQQLETQQTKQSEEKKPEIVVREKPVEKKEELKPKVKKEEKKPGKEKIIVSPHYKDSATSSIGFNLNSVL